MAYPSCSVPVIIWTSEAPDSDSTFAEALIILAIYDKTVRVLLQGNDQGSSLTKGTAIL